MRKARQKKSRLMNESDLYEKCLKLQKKFERVRVVKRPNFTKCTNRQDIEDLLISIKLPRKGKFAWSTKNIPLNSIGSSLHELSAVAAMYSNDYISSRLRHQLMPLLMERRILNIRYKKFIDRIATALPAIYGRSMSTNSWNLLRNRCKHTTKIIRKQAVHSQLITFFKN
jgi:hypothetical protein